MRHRVSSLVRAEVGTQMTLSIHEPQRPLGRDVTVDFIRGQLTLTRTDKQILATGALSSSVAVECVRCLEIFHLPLQLQVEELFALSPGPAPIDPVYAVDWDGTLDLAPVICDQILLALPIGSVCRPDCRGLCPNCGQNLNEGRCDCHDESADPRLAALQALL